MRAVIVGIGLSLLSIPSVAWACSDGDSDDDGLLDAAEDLNADGDCSNDDTDGDETPNYLDPDDDGDGTPTKDEAPDPDGNGLPDDAVDSDSDGTPDYLDAVDNGPNGDNDGDGIPNGVELFLGSNPDHVDTDADGLWDSGETALTMMGWINFDSDEDEIPDVLDIDDDNDGIYTLFEQADPDGDNLPWDATDSDGDAMPNYLDVDDDGDGVLTADESPDPNRDGNPDDALDSDRDGIPDYLDTVYDEPPEDTDPPGETDTPSDSDEPQDTDTPGEGGGCGCGHIPLGPSTMFLSLFLAGWLLRRRTSKHHQ